MSLKKDAVKFNRLFVKKMKEMEVTPGMAKVAKAGAAYLMELAGIKTRRKRRGKAKVRNARHRDPR
jgi:hypothetical protein